MAIYYLCADTNHPSGGIKVIYRHVDILNNHGFEAYVLHRRPEFRCTWFENETKIAYFGASFLQRFEKPSGESINLTRPLLSRVNAKIRRALMPGTAIPIAIAGARSKCINVNDFLVLPENQGPGIGDFAPGIKKLILNQGLYLMFKGYSFSKERLNNPYTRQEMAAVLVNSEECQRYMRYVFPQTQTYRFRLSIDSDLFSYEPQKKLQICFSQIKNTADALQVINMLKFRNALDGVELVSFINRPQREVAQIFKESLIFLSLGNREGFGLPAAEAMACGCIVIGYHGGGGKEFFKPGLCYPVDEGDLVGIATRIEKVIDEYNRDSNAFVEQTTQAARFIAEEYAPAREETELLAIWNAVSQPNESRAATR